MTESFQEQELTKQSLGWYRAKFNTLDSPTIAEMNGRFHSEFVGPGLLSTFEPYGLAILMGGIWQGKIFDGNGHGMNIVRRKGVSHETMPVVLKKEVSLLNGRSGLNITYPSGSRFPWPWVVDEIRWLNEDTLLGMTLVTKAGLYRLALPFFLHKNKE